jgi:hypothetical protein
MGSPEASASISVVPSVCTEFCSATQTLNGRVRVSIRLEKVSADNILKLLQFTGPDKREHLETAAQGAARGIMLQLFKDKPSTSNLAEKFEPGTTSRKALEERIQAEVRQAR